jgi:hypothetical protein
MAQVWFVRREGGKWIAPGGKPYAERPLASLVFPLDLGPQRWLADERPEPAPELPAEDPTRLAKVIVATDARDLDGLELTWFRVGFYDSPYAPREVVRRLAGV